MRHKGAYTRRRRRRGGEKRKIEQKKRGGGDRDANNCGKPVNRLVNDLNYDYVSLVWDFGCSRKMPSNLI